VTLLAHVQDDETVSSQAYPAAGTLFQDPHGKIPTHRFTGEPGVDKYNRTEYSIAYLLEHRATDALTLRQNARYYSTDFDQVVVFTSGLAADQRTLERQVFAGDGELDGVTVDTHAQIRFPTGPLAHTLLAGVDVQRVEVSARQAFGGAPGLDAFSPVYGAAVRPAPVFLDTETVELQVGLYLHDQIKLGRWILSGGGRYDWADAETRDRLTRQRTDQEDRQFTGRAGLLYAFEAGVSPYFSYAESFLPVAGTDATGRPFEPETGRQYEVGVKYQPPGWNTTLTRAVFDLTRPGAGRRRGPDPQSEPHRQLHIPRRRDHGERHPRGAGQAADVSAVAPAHGLDLGRLHAPWRAPGRIRLWCGRPVSRVDVR
jgi:iron complex outermembrane receptor protein